MLHDTYNINLAARLLKKLILYDYPDCDTRHLTDEQFILAGSRYNRGTERKKERKKYLSNNKSIPNTILNGLINRYINKEKIASNQEDTL